MLFNSFSHIPGIGPTTEKKIWNAGVHSLDQFIETPPEFLTSRKKMHIQESLQTSARALESNDANFFYEGLASSEHWRLFKELREHVAYLDIETTGLGDPGDIITTIALYDGKEVKHYVQGQNLDDFVEDVQAYQVLVTFNGKQFDIPFIERYWRIKITQAQIDLRFVLKSLGHGGGLKRVEQKLGLGRTGELAEIDGFFAVLLWRDYMRTRDPKSLHTLLSYNIEDVLNLESLMVFAYNQKIKDLPFDLESIEPPRLTKNPFDVDAPTVRRIKRNY